MCICFEYIYCIYTVWGLKWCVTSCASSTGSSWYCRETISLPCWTGFPTATKKPRCTIKSYKQTACVEQSFHDQIYKSNQRQNMCVGSNLIPAQKTQNCVVCYVHSRKAATIHSGFCKRRVYECLCVCEKERIWKTAYSRWSACHTRENHWHYWLSCCTVYINFLVVSHRHIWLDTQVHVHMYM